MILDKTVRFGPVTAGAAQTDFPYVGAVYAEEDFKVYVLPVGTTTWLLKTPPGDFSVTNLGDEAGGVVRFTAGLTSGDKVIGIIDTPDTQGQKLPAAGLAPAVIVELMVDKVIRRLNRIEDKLLGALVLQDTDARLALPSLPTPVADNFLQWNATATKIINNALVAIGSASAVDETDSTSAVKDKMISNQLTNLFYLLSLAMTGVDVASAVNKLTITNAATGNKPKIEATGGDANIGLELVAKGNGDIVVGPSTGAAKGAAVLPEKVDGPIASFMGSIAAHKNLVVTDASVSTVDVDADEVILTDAAGKRYLAEAVNLTADITVSGANGLDTGAEANSTWYYIFVIYNPTTDTLAALLSISETAPTMPSGYTFKGLVGTVFNSSGGDFGDFGQIDRFVRVPEYTILSNGTSAALAAVDSLASPIAKELNVQVIVESANTSAGDKSAAVQPESSGTRGRVVVIGRHQSAPGAGDKAIATTIRAVKAKAAHPNIYYLATSGSQVDLLINGWTF